MKPKRDLVAGLSSATLMTALLERLPKRPSIIVLNYHRIGAADETQYDPGVFSATAKEFEWQVNYLKRHFEIATLDAVVAMVKGETPVVPSVLITFDDGYLDNYELAFPILHAAGVQGTFFLPTSFIGTDRLPWWDVIAYVVKKSRTNRFKLSYPCAVEVDIESEGINSAIARVLKVYKHPDMKDHDRFISELLKASDSSLPAQDAEACFMNWEQAREMQDGGMAFGGHTHSHEILSKLPVERQFEELQKSREILERELKRPIVTMAYPVGGRDAFSRDTEDMARKSGYAAAFSFYGGFNLPGNIRPYDVHRFGVDQQSHSRLRLQMALGAVSATVWV